MDQGDKNISWQDGELMEVTEPSIVSTMVEEVPTLTVAAVVGVTIVVLLTIAAVFLLGVLIDCRQQKLLEKMCRMKKTKIQKRVINNADEIDDLGIAANMEETATSIPPATILQNIP